MIKIENKSVNGSKSKTPLWLVAVILISSLMLIFMLYLRAGDVNRRIGEYELNIACDDTREQVRSAIINYINSTDDVRLTFGTGISTQNVDMLLENLQKGITYKGQKYGPFLDFNKNQIMPNYFKKTILGSDKAVRINIHIKSNKVDISPDTKDSITYLDD